MRCVAAAHNAAVTIDRFRCTCARPCLPMHLFPYVRPLFSSRKSLDWYQPAILKYVIAID